MADHRSADPPDGDLRAPARTADTPPTVVINEAIELARTFSAEEAVPFVNGVLDAVRKTLEERVDATPDRDHD